MNLQPVEQSEDMVKLQEEISTLQEIIKMNNSRVQVFEAYVKAAKPADTSTEALKQCLDSVRSL